MKNNSRRFMRARLQNVKTGMCFFQLSTAQIHWFQLLALACPAHYGDSDCWFKGMTQMLRENLNISEREGLMTGTKVVLNGLIFKMALVAIFSLQAPSAKAAEEEMIYCRAEPPSDYSSSVIIGNTSLRPIRIKTPMAFIAYKFPVKWVPGTPLKTACLTPRLSETFIKERLKPEVKSSAWYSDVNLRLNIDGKDTKLVLQVGLSYDFDGNKVERRRKAAQRTCNPVADQPDEFGLLRFSGAKEGPLKRISELACRAGSSFTSYPVKGGKSISRIDCALGKDKQPDRCVMYFQHHGWGWYLKFPGDLLPAWPEIYQKVVAQLNHTQVISISPEGCQGEQCKKVMGVLKK